MSQPSHYYITTPIYYVNDRPHIGHVYTTTLADVLARWHRLCGREVFFLTGTDEHAAKVVDSAAANGMSAQQWADRNAGEFESTFRKLGTNHDDFIRTSQERHKTRVVRYIQQLQATGDVYQGEYEGWYDAGQEEYVPENKAKEQGYRSAINGKPLVRKTEKNYFFRLSKYQQPLRELLERRPGFVQPDSRRNEIYNRVVEGLNDVPISRTGSGGWGIPMPGDEQQAVYVWIDALFNYLTTVDTDERRYFWPANVHLIAKDILWFHAVIWPALLMALGRELPRQVYAHSFWISEGQKMSKSLGNFIDLEKIDCYVKDFGLDSLRWFLATQGPIGTTDSDFAHDRFVEVYNAELANVLGNCSSRVTNMIAKYFDSKLPAPDTACEDEAAQRLRQGAEQLHAKVVESYEKLAIGAANHAAMEVVRAVDGYIEATQPFKLAKDPAQKVRLGTILYNCAEALRIAGLHLQPVLCEKAEKLLCQLGAESTRPCSRWGQLKPGTSIVTGLPLFPRHQNKPE